MQPFQIKGEIMYFEEPEQAMNNIYRFISRGNPRLAEDCLRKLIEDPEYDIQYLRNIADRNRLNDSCIKILWGDK